MRCHPTASAFACVFPARRAALVGALAFAGAGAQGAVFVVDTTSDDGSITFQACTDAAPDDCSLRGALTRANANSDVDEIHFAIPDSDPGYVAVTTHWRITPATDLPHVFYPVTIDGYTQAGAMPNTLAPDEGGSDAVLKIELTGNGRNSSLGLTGYDISLRGLAVNDFSQNLYLGLGAHVEGCFIGTDITGMTAAGSGAGNRIGIHLVSGTSGQVIGGATPAARNLIAGQSYLGVWDESGRTAQPNLYQGNLFGLAADGTTVLPGQDYGIYMNGAPQGTLIGGDSVAARNVFGGNEFGALVVTDGSMQSGPSAPIRIQGNHFGTDYSGTLPRPNGTNPGSPTQTQPTIQISRMGACSAQVGGDAPGEGNLIANGAAAGVLIATCTGAAVLGNAFERNRIGIDLSPGGNADGATPDDTDDSDEGGNRLQNAPVIDTVAYVDGGETIELRFHVDTALANAAYPLRIDVGAGRGGQAAFLATTIVYAAADARSVATARFPVSALHGAPIVLNATDALGNTSESGSEALFADGFEP